MDAKFNRWVAVAVFAITPAIWCQAEPPNAESVGQPLPALPSAVSKSTTTSAEITDAPAPQEPAPLALPPWLVTPEPTAKADDIAAAFDIRDIQIDIPDPNAQVATDVQLASATSRVDDTRTAAILATAEKLASDARSMGDLNDLIELCAGTGTLGVGSQPSPAIRNPKVARVLAWAFNRRGEMRAEQGDDRTAFEDFARAIRVDPGCWNALHNRGITFAKYGRHQLAMEDFTQALRLNPKCAACFGNRGELLMEMGQAAPAEIDFTAAIAAEPNNPVFHAGRAACRQRQGRLNEAVRDLNEAIRLAPRRADYFAHRGGLYAQAGYVEQAVADFDAALQLDSHCTAAYQSVAWLLSTSADARFRDAEKALEAARRALQLGAAGDPFLLDTVAAAHASAGLMDDAVRYQQQALLSAPGDMQMELRDRLALYRQGKPYRQAAAEASGK